MKIIDLRGGIRRDAPEGIEEFLDFSCGELRIVQGLGVGVQVTDRFYNSCACSRLRRWIM
jgi:hypothetical protein